MVSEVAMEKATELSQAAGIIAVQTEMNIPGTVVMVDELSSPDDDNENGLVWHGPGTSWDTWSNRGLAVVRHGWTAWNQGSSCPVPMHQI